MLLGLKNMNDRRSSEPDSLYLLLWGTRKAGCVMSTIYRWITLCFVSILNNILVKRMEVCLTT